MGVKIYTDLKDLKAQERDVFEFGDSLGKTSSKKWNDDSDDDNDLFEDFGGNSDENPWDDFSYVIIPDGDDDIDTSIEIGESLGEVRRYDCPDPEYSFFVVV